MVIEVGLLMLAISWTIIPRVLATLAAASIPLIVIFKTHGGREALANVKEKDVVLVPASPRISFLGALHAAFGLFAFVFGMFFTQTVLQAWVACICALFITAVGSLLIYCVRASYALVARDWVEVREPGRVRRYVFAELKPLGPPGSRYTLPGSYRVSLSMGFPKASALTRLLEQRWIEAHDPASRSGPGHLSSDQLMDQRPVFDYFCGVALMVLLYGKTRVRDSEWSQQPGSRLRRPRLVMLALQRAYADSKDQAGWFRPNPRVLGFAAIAAFWGVLFFILFAVGCLRMAPAVSLGSFGGAAFGVVALWEVRRWAARLLANYLAQIGYCHRSNIDGLRRENRENLRKAQLSSARAPQHRRGVRQPRIWFDYLCGIGLMILLYGKTQMRNSEWPEQSKARWSQPRLIMLAYEKAYADSGDPSGGSALNPRVLGFGAIAICFGVLFFALFGFIFLWIAPVLSLGFFAFAVFSAVALLQGRRNAARMLADYRARIGHCRYCGYDLRATADRCPECGTPVQADSVYPYETPLLVKGAARTTDRTLAFAEAVSSAVSRLVAFISNFFSNDLRSGGRRTGSRK